MQNCIHIICSLSISNENNQEAAISATRLAQAKSIEPIRTWVAAAAGRTERAENNEQLMRAIRRLRLDIPRGGPKLLPFLFSRDLIYIRQRIKFDKGCAQMPGAPARQNRVAAAAKNLQMLRRRREREKSEQSDRVVEERCTRRRGLLLQQPGRIQGWNFTRGTARRPSLYPAISAGFNCESYVGGALIRSGSLGIFADFSSTHFDRVTLVNNTI